MLSSVKVRDIELNLVPDSLARCHHWTPGRGGPARGWWMSAGRPPALRPFCTNSEQKLLCLIWP